MTTRKAIAVANHEIVTLAVYLLGGDTHRVDTEDVAVKANDLAHGRFTWRKYRDQINIDANRRPFQTRFRHEAASRISQPYRGRG
ncbi:MAG TPA: hypothetical protein DCE44_19690 [Verrucomicrobiales bacterium]|nr:hypothetical protein [Verrucomicrobiales bacterium]